MYIDKHQQSNPVFYVLCVLLCVCEATVVSQIGEQSFSLKTNIQLMLVYIYYKDKNICWLASLESKNTKLASNYVKYNNFVLLILHISANEIMSQYP